jgi:hypothetical protein
MFNTGIVFDLKIKILKKILNCYKVNKPLPHL